MAETEPNNPANNDPPRRWRFGLRSLFLVMAYVAVVLALAKLWGFMCVFIITAFATPVVFCRRGLSRDVVAMRNSIVYLAASIVTLPYLGSFWFGELPVLALPQVPKTEFADWLRSIIIFQVIRPLGLSRGSISPDMIFASPYALALAYLIPIGIMLAVIAWRTKLAAPYRYWALALVIVAIIDYFMMRAYASGPGLTIY